VPTNFARDWIEGRFATMVREALATVLAAEVQLKVVVDAQAAALPEVGPGPEEPPATSRDSSGAHGNGGQASVAMPNHAAATHPQPDLNPRYVFDRFVVGPHNEYATAVARSVAESPAVAYNPVFVYADTGLGKTHLIQAIAHAVLARDPRLQVKYVTVERFTDDFINAVTDKGRIEGFKQTYRDNDVLIIDDVQFLAEKQQTQVEFFHTYNHLSVAGKQTVITRDRQPRELEAL
jgi:chromosomal replication initiator protein